MKILEEYPDYVIYEDGRVYSNISNKFISFSVNEFGYYRAGLINKDGFSKAVKLHRLVATAYHLNPENKREVNHIDGNKEHNHARNLEWVTSKENKTHAWDNDLYTHKGDNHYAANFTDEEIHAMCVMLQDGSRNVDVARAFNTDKGMIANLKTGRNWKHISENYTFDVVRKARKSPELIRKVCDLILSGLTNAEISRKLPIDARDVSRIKRKEIHTRISCDYF